MDLWITQEQLEERNCLMVTGEEFFIPLVNKLGLRKGKYRIVQVFPTHGLAEIAYINQHSKVLMHFLS